MSKQNGMNPALPVDWYFDPKLYELEMTLLFANGPGYVGHELMVPAEGDYHVLDWLHGGGRMLVRGREGVGLLSNVCRHRQALMLKGRGNAGNVVCPFHRWTYGLDGQLMGAPQFPANPCLHLDNKPLQAWRGMLFQGGRDIGTDLAGMGAAGFFDFSGYVYDRTVVTDYRFNWKTFIEVYLEDYHVVPYHPGLGQFVDCGKLQWQYGDCWSVQTVGANQGLARPGSEVYRRWSEQVLLHRGGRPPEHGAVWLTYYPNIMLEWYPDTLVVSTIVPTGVESCLNVVEYYYPEEIALFEREYVEAEQAAYRETAIEDDDICYGMHNGRKALYEQGLSQEGPYQSPTEDGMGHFHEWYRRIVSPYL